MSGQCYGCGISYGVFKKEHSCKNCHFSFCTKCVNKRIEIPQLDKQKHLVCTKCYDLLTKRIQPGEFDTKPRPPPDTYYKRIAELNEDKKSNAAKVVNPAVNAKYKNMAKPDQDLAARLNQLQATDKTKKTIPSLSELDNRLQRLKDSEAGTSGSTAGASSTSTYTPPERRTHTEQTDDLLAQMHDEVKIDQRNESRTTYLSDRVNALGHSDNKVDANNLNKPDDGVHKSYHKNISGPSGESRGGDSMADVNRMIAEMANELEMDARAAIEGLQKDKQLQQKLQELKKKEKNNRDDQNDESEGANINASDDENNDDTVNALIKKLLEESALDDAMEQSGINISKTGNSSDQVNDPDELPWCCMCNEDANVRCVQCDMDLYCHKCFKKCHRQTEMKDHKASKYVRPKGLQNV